jgi:hypothetical protein
MGISDLRPALPWIYIKDYLSAFPLHTLLFDAANILFWCALHHAAEFEKGIRLHSARQVCENAGGPEAWGKAGFGATKSSPSPGCGHRARLEGLESARA